MRLYALVRLRMCTISGRDRSRGILICICMYMCTLLSQFGLYMANQAETFESVVRGHHRLQYKAIWTPHVRESLTVFLTLE